MAAAWHQSTSNNKLAAINAGNMVVDGVAASSYVDMLGSERSMHAMMSIGRTLWRISPSCVKWLHARRITEPLMLGIGAFLRKVTVSADHRDSFKKNVAPKTRHITGPLMLGISAFLRKVRALRMRIISAFLA